MCLVGFLSYLPTGQRVKQWGEAIAHLQGQFFEERERKSGPESAPNPIQKCQSHFSRSTRGRKEIKNLEEIKEEENIKTWAAKIYVYILFAKNFCFHVTYVVEKK